MELFFELLFRLIAVFVACTTVFAVIIWIGLAVVILKEIFKLGEPKEYRR